jgi:general secretion pathway protein E
MEKRETFAQALCAILVKHNVISEAEGRSMQRSFKNSSKENFDDFLLSEGLVDEEDVLKALGDYYQVPPVDVTGYFFDTVLLRNFPKDFLLRNRIIPLEMEDDILVIVASEPDNPDLLPALGAYTSEDIRFNVGLSIDITDAIKEYYDKSLTDLLDEGDYTDEKLEEKERFHDLIHEEDEFATVEEEDLGEEE